MVDDVDVVVVVDDDVDNDVVVDDDG